MAACIGKTIRNRYYTYTGTYTYSCTRTISCTNSSSSSSSSNNSKSTSDTTGSTVVERLQNSFKAVLSKHRNPSTAISTSTAINTSTDQSNTVTTSTSANQLQQFMILLIGLPGSGKTTFATALQKQHPNRFIRINQDELGYRRKCIRVTETVLNNNINIIRNYNSNNNNDNNNKTDNTTCTSSTTTTTTTDPVVALVETKIPIIDRCNFNLVQRQPFIMIAKEFSIPVDCIIFNYPRIVCEERCIKRRYHPTLSIKKFKKFNLNNDNNNNNNNNNNINNDSEGKVITDSFEDTLTMIMDSIQYQWRLPYEQKQQQQQQQQQQHITADQSLTTNINTSTPIIHNSSSSSCNIIHDSSISSIQDSNSTGDCTDDTTEFTIGTTTTNNDNNDNNCDYGCNNSNSDCEQQQQQQHQHQLEEEVIRHVYTIHNDDEFQQVLQKYL